MIDTYKYQMRESPQDASPQPSRGDPYEPFPCIRAVLPIHPLPHFQQGGALLRSLKRDYRDYWQQLRPRRLQLNQLRHGGGGH